MKVALEPPAEYPRAGKVGLPGSRRYREARLFRHGKEGADERAQARNLGGTAEAAFRPKQGERLLFAVNRFLHESAGKEEIDR